MDINVLETISSRITALQTQVDQLTKEYQELVGECLVRKTEMTSLCDNIANIVDGHFTKNLKSCAFAAVSRHS